MPPRQLLLLVVDAFAAIGLTIAAASSPHAAISEPAAPKPTTATIMLAGWSAGEHGAGGGRVCYASVRSARAEGTAGGRRAVLVVARRVGRAEEWVAIAPDYTLVRDATVEMTVGATRLAFRSEGGDAFARDGRAAVRAFLKGREATAVVRPGPGGRGAARVTFSLIGFGVALEAMSRVCPTG
ncbi:hypothetical protein [Roseomonas mucosa]